MQDEFMTVCSTLMFDPRFFVEGERILKLIFEEMTLEAA